MQCTALPIHQKFNTLVLESCLVTSYSTTGSSQRTQNRNIKNGVFSFLIVKYNFSIQPVLKQGCFYSYISTDTFFPISFRWYNCINVSSGSGCSISTHINKLRSLCNLQNRKICGDRHITNFAPAATQLQVIKYFLIVHKFFTCNNPT